MAVDRGQESDEQGPRQGSDEGGRELTGVNSGWAPE